MARSSGDTLSLNNLAGALGQTQNSNVSLDTLNSSAGTQVSIDEYGIDSVGQTLSGYTYAVEGTNETYEVTFGGAGSKFSNIRNRGLTLHGQLHLLMILMVILLDIFN